MARKNVTKVFRLWSGEKPGNGDSTGTIRTDGTTILSYAMPIVTRQAGRVFIAKRGRSLYSQTTTIHLSGLHSLMIGDRILEVDQEDVVRARLGGDALEEVIIKYA